MQSTINPAPTHPAHPAVAEVPARAVSPELSPPPLGTVDSVDSAVGPVGGFAGVGGNVGGFVGVDEGDGVDGIGGVGVGGVGGNEWRVIRRNGGVVRFDLQKIRNAILKAFLDKKVMGPKAAESSQVRDIVERAAAEVAATLRRRNPLGGAFHIEDIQDQVELALLRDGHHKVAREYMLYRRERAKLREAGARKLMEEARAGDENTAIGFTDRDGNRRQIAVEDLVKRINLACANLIPRDKTLRLVPPSPSAPTHPDPDSAGVGSGVGAGLGTSGTAPGVSMEKPKWGDINPEAVLKSALREMYDGMPETEMRWAPILAARAMIETNPAYSLVSARLLLDLLRWEVLGCDLPHSRMESLYPKCLRDALHRGVEAELVNPKLRSKFNLDKLGRALRPERDLQFGYLGLQTLYDRYFLRVDGKPIETPQTFFMRVAMGLALNESDPDARAAEFYDLLSSFRFMSSTPTLFNSGTIRSQLSSCYLTTVPDHLDGIFEAYKENALLAKFAGGLGNDWTPVRAMGSRIKGTNGKSQGVIPFLKIVNDTAVAVNQGGKRKGAACCYLETWHMDIEAFLELRKNSGDERRRAHDMNTANWIPDLFMKRVLADGEWTLLSPSDAPHLHDLCGAEFERAYGECEARAARGDIRARKVRARDLWRKMLTMLFETGHPWVTFKDACNIRSPQRHAGVVHSSNLCTEITLNTGADEIAVCNLGSVNLAAHVRDGQLDDAAMRSTIRTAMRMLDNVIDINYYAVDKARRSNMRHRPVGLGVMGFQDCLHEMGISYNSDAAVEFADRSMEAVCYHAYSASADLAEERGRYESFEGGAWSQGKLPPDTLRDLARERGQDSGTDGEGGDISGEFLEVDMSATKDWGALRKRIAAVGMRNSNCAAIAPTATIANIVGVSPSIEPNYQNIFVKSNLSGDFTVCNRHLVAELRAAGLWDEVMLADIKYYDGRLDPVDRIPADIKRRYATAFEIDPKWLIEAAARRQKWIDQAQSLNLYIAGASGRRLDEMYKLAWRRGLKTTYYLRSLGATSTEKYTSRAGAHNAVPSGGGLSNGADGTGEMSASGMNGNGAANGGMNGNGMGHSGNGASPSACAIDDPECEACQ